MVKEISSQRGTPHAFWNIPVQELLSYLGTSLKGLPREVAEERLRQSGSQIKAARVKTNQIKLFLSQFKSPVISSFFPVMRSNAFRGDAFNSGVMLLSLSQLLQERYNAA